MRYAGRSLPRPAELRGRYRYPARRPDETDVRFDISPEWGVRPRRPGPPPAAVAAITDDPRPPTALLLQMSLESST